MESSELQAMLREKMENMPTKARRVVEYLLSNTREAAFLSIGEVAEKLEVSKAQLVRVSRMVGFEGYADLKDSLQNTVLEQVNPTALLGKIMKNRQDLPGEILRLEHANIDDTWNQLKPKDIVAFCGMVKKASMVYCMGWGISSILAESLYTRFLEMGIRGALMKRGSLALIEQARTVTKGDLVVVCELPSYVIEVTESIKKAAANGASIITITDSPAAPVCQYSNLSFYVSDTSPTFGSSIVGPVFLIHVLTSVLCVNLGEKVKAALEDQEQGLHDERIYYPAYGLKYSQEKTEQIQPRLKAGMYSRLYCISSNCCGRKGRKKSAAVLCLFYHRQEHLEPGNRHHTVGHVQPILRKWESIFRLCP